MTKQFHEALTRQEVEALYSELENSLFNIAYRYVWNESVALELVQETFLRIWKKRSDIRRETAKSYIYKTLINLSANSKRETLLKSWITLESVRNISSEGAGGDPETSMIQSEEIRITRKCLKNLPEKLRKVFLMCEYSGLSYEETGEILGISSGTVGSRKSRAVSRLREEVGRLLKNNADALE